MTQSKIKVLYLIERLARAGTELHLLTVLHHLDRQRFEPVLCCLSKEMTDQSLVPRDLPCHFLDAEWNLARLSSWRLYRKVRRLIAKEKPDIVHSFLFVSNIMGPFAAHAEKVRGVVASRGRMGIEWDANFMHRMLQRSADRRTGAIVCKTDAMKDEIAKFEMVANEKIHVVANGVDTQLYAPNPAGPREKRLAIEKEFGVPSDGPLALAVGNLKPIKGHCTLLEAVKAIRQNVSDIRLAVVGTGEAEQELRTFIGENNLAKHIFLPGRSEDVRGWMQAADIFVAPSVSEGMPNALLEAMSMALPLVLSDIPGHSETAGDVAWYFRPEDSGHLAEVLCAALTDPDTCVSRGNEARRIIQENLSIDTMIARIEQVYDQLLVTT